MQVSQKKKLSKSAWFLIFLLIAAIITVAVLALVGMISLQFLADIIVGYNAFGATGWMVGTLTIALPFLCGILCYYIVKVYFIGNKTTTPIGGGYAPTPYTPSAAQKDTETVIS